MVTNFRKPCTISRGSVIIWQNKWRSNNLSLILDLQQHARFVKRLSKTPTAFFERGSVENRGHRLISGYYASLKWCLGDILDSITNRCSVRRSDSRKRRKSRLVIFVTVNSSSRPWWSGLCHFRVKCNTNRSRTHSVFCGIGEQKVILLPLLLLLHRSSRHCYSKFLFYISGCVFLAICC